jgi:hypothetical protein
MAERKRFDTLRRILLAGVAIPALEIGVWASLWPTSFFDHFPGGGRAWVQADGPYNEHLVRDVGGLYLALAIVIIAAAVHLRPGLVRVAAWAALVNGLPHFVYHLRHLDLYGTSDKIANAVSLGLATLAPVVVLLLTTRESHPLAPALEH